MASPTPRTWVWVNSGSWWWTRRPGVLQFMGLQRVGHDWATELNWTELSLSLLSCQSSHFSSLGDLVPALPSVQVPCCFGLLVPTKLTLNDLSVSMTGSGFVSVYLFLYSQKLFCIVPLYPKSKIVEKRILLALVVPVVHPDTVNNAQVEQGVLIYGGSLVAKSCSTLATPWTVARKAPLFLGFSRQEYWSGLLFPCPGDLPNPEIEPGSPALQADSLPTELPRKPLIYDFYFPWVIYSYEKSLWTGGLWEENWYL